MCTSIASSRGAISDHVRQAAQVGDVEGAVVGRAVVADEAGAVHREDDVELLQADVVDDLVEGALQEGRVDRADRLGALRARARRRTAPRAARRCRRRSSCSGSSSASMSRPGAAGHRGGDADHARSRCASATSASPKTSVYCGGAGGAARLRRRGDRPCRRRRRPPFDDRLRLGRVPLLHALEAALLGGREALALDGGDVDDDRAVGLERLAAARARSALHVVAVDHAHVGESSSSKNRPGRPVGLDRLLELRAEALDRARRCRRAAWSAAPRRPRGRGSSCGFSRTRLK